MKLKSNAFLIAISAVVLGLIAGGILMIAIGSNPFEGFYYLCHRDYLDVSWSFCCVCLQNGSF